MTNKYYQYVSAENYLCSKINLRANRQYMVIVILSNIPNDTDTEQTLPSVMYIFGDKVE